LWWVFKKIKKDASHSSKEFQKVYVSQSPKMWGNNPAPGSACFEVIATKTIFTGISSFEVSWDTECQQVHVDASVGIRNE
jgi:hypothetical protein